MITDKPTIDMLSYRGVNLVPRGRFDSISIHWFQFDSVTVFKKISDSMRSDPTPLDPIHNSQRNIQRANCYPERHNVEITIFGNNNESIVKYLNDKKRTVPMTNLCNSFK